MTKKPIPVITSFGGVNASGRSSDHVGYQNTVFDSLSKKDQIKVLKDLAVMQGLIKASGSSWSKDSEKIENLNDFLSQNSDQIRSNTMVRKLDRELYDPDGIILDQIKASAGGQLPTGFNPGSFYPSRQHARALQMTIFGMSDTLGQF